MGITIASITAMDKVFAISIVNPDFCKANPPFKPRAIKRYNDKNFVIAGGISKLDLTAPAKTPKIKNKIAGSRIFCIYL
jgi:hypothetical protein